MDQINDLKHKLKSAFKVKDPGVVKKIFRVELIRDRKKGMLYLSQQKYVRVGNECCEQVYGRFRE